MDASLDLKQIRYFLHLADTLNFTRAAEMSGVKQPTLTKAIQKLESGLGGPLVYREGKDTRLTELGRTIRGEFEKIVMSEMKARELANVITGQKRSIVNLGVANTIGPGLFTKFLSRVLADLDHVQLVIHPVKPEMVAEVVLAGSLDCAITTDYVGGNDKLQSLPLFSEELVVGVGEAHRFAAMENVPVKELEKEAYVDRLNCEFRARVLEDLVARNIVLQPRLRSDREDWVQRYVADGYGVCTLPELSAVAPGLLLRPLKETRLKRMISFVSILGSAASGSTRGILDHAKRHRWINGDDNNENA